MRRATPPPPQPPAQPARHPAGEKPPAASGAELPLPHERDESPHASAPHPDPAIRQAGKDLAEGQVDTDMRATPGLDAQRRERLVPGTAGRVRRRR